MIVCIIPIKYFDENPTTYGDKVEIDHGEFARNDPMGFYHGMKVTFRGKPYVLCGPPVLVSPGVAEPVPQPPQGLLFDL